jgi:hypothetical protein
MTQSTESIAEVLERVHRETSPHLGRLCIALERRVIKAEDLIAWARCLRRGADDLDILARRLNRAREEKNTCDI